MRRRRRRRRRRKRRRRRRRTTTLKMTKKMMKLLVFARRIFVANKDVSDGDGGDARASGIFFQRRKRTVKPAYHAPQQHPFDRMRRRGSLSGQRRGGARCVEEDCSSREDFPSGVNVFRFFSAGHA